MSATTLWPSSPQANANCWVNARVSATATAFINILRATQRGHDRGNWFCWEVVKRSTATSRSGSKRPPQPEADDVDLAPWVESKAARSTETALIEPAGTTTDDMGFAIATRPS